MSGRWSADLSDRPHGIEANADTFPARRSSPLHHMEHAVELLDVIDGDALLQPERLG